MSKRLLLVSADTLGAHLAESADRADWEVLWVSEGGAVPGHLDRGAFDVIAVDQEVPDLDWRGLMGRVAQERPDTVRVLLVSGFDGALMGQCTGLVHQVLSKPVNPEQFRALVSNAIQLGSRLVDGDLRRTVARVECLPSLPRLYRELRDALEDEGIDAKRIGDILQVDIGMTAKILRVVNSALFGLRRAVATPQEAVSFLGVDTIKALVLTHGVFDQTGTLGCRMVTLEDVWNHTLNVAKGARAIAAMEGLGREEALEAFTGGMLHDVGILVLAKNFPHRYDRVVLRAEAERVAVVVAEKREFGVTHAEVGAYLLGLWGLSSGILEAVSLHHHPSVLRTRRMTPLMAIHAADYLCGTKGAHPMFERPTMDMRALEVLGASERLVGWQKVMGV